MFYMQLLFIEDINRFEEVTMYCLCVQHHKDKFLCWTIKNILIKF